jgi:hypothetical protein
MRHSLSTASTSLEEHELLVTLLDMIAQLICAVELLVAVNVDAPVPGPPMLGLHVTPEVACATEVASQPLVQWWSTSSVVTGGAAGARLMGA